MLAKKPEQRFSNYAELIAALDTLSSSTTAAPGHHNNRRKSRSSPCSMTSRSPFRPPSARPSPRPRHNCRLSRWLIGGTGRVRFIPRRHPPSRASNRPKPIVAPVAVIDALTVLGAGTEHGLVDRTVDDAGHARCRRTADERVRTLLDHHVRRDWPRPHCVRHWLRSFDPRYVHDVRAAAGRRLSPARAAAEPEPAVPVAIAATAQPAAVAITPKRQPVKPVPTAVVVVP